MNFVTCCARHLIPGVAALQATNMGRLIQVTGKTDFIGGGRSQFRWIANVFRRRRLGMFLSGAVARFASLPFPAAFGVRFYLMMRILGERIVDILVTRLARLRPHSSRGRLASRGSESEQDYSAAPRQINTAHAPCRRQTCRQSHGRYHTLPQAR